MTEKAIKAADGQTNRLVPFLFGLEPECVCVVKIDLEIECAITAPESV